MTLQRVKGVTFTHLITNRCLTPGRLVRLLESLRELHSSAGDPATRLPVDQLPLAANYQRKISKRYSSHKVTYRALAASAAAAAGPLASTPPLDPEAMYAEMRRGRG